MSFPGYPKALIRAPKISYERRNITGRGVGLVATEKIEAGTLIFTERPLMVMMYWGQPNYDIHLPQEERTARVSLCASLSRRLLQLYTQAMKEMEGQLQSVYSTMSPENQRKFRSLANSHRLDGSGPLLGIFRTNGWGIETMEPDPEGARLGAPDGIYMAVGDLSSRLNHRCDPLYRMNPHHCRS